MGREGDSGEDQPIIGKWHQADQLKRDLLGKGFESQVHRQTFDTPDGPQGYAIKDVDPARGGFRQKTNEIYEADDEAKRILGVYNRLKSAGLPVVSFMKSIHKTDESGTRVAKLAMEDATEGGEYKIEEIYMTEGKLAFVESSESEELALEMVESMAILHNNGLYHFHSGLSFFLKTSVREPDESELLILDYANFADKENPCGPLGRKEGVFDFETACEENIDFLLHYFSGYFPPEFEGELASTYVLLRAVNKQKLVNNTTDASSN